LQVLSKMCSREKEKVIQYEGHLLYVETEGRCTCDIPNTKQQSLFVYGTQWENIDQTVNRPENFYLCLRL